MRTKIVEITGAGPHEVIPAVSGERIIVEYMFLTFSHQEAQAQMLRLLSGSDVFLATYVLDGGELEYERREDDTTRIAIGEAFNIQMTTGLSAAGRVDYTMGAQ